MTVPAKLAQQVNAVVWTKVPGGKRYSITMRGRTVTCTRMNTAAGALLWRAVLTSYSDPRGRIVASGDYLSDVKRRALAVLEKTVAA
jgi:hypothetical protein